MDVVEFEIFVESWRQDCSDHGGWLGAGVKDFAKKLADIACVACECSKLPTLGDECARRVEIFKSLRGLAICVVGAEAWTDYDLARVVEREAEMELSCVDEISIRKVVAKAFCQNALQEGARGLGDKFFEGNGTLFGIGMGAALSKAEKREEPHFSGRGSLEFKISALFRAKRSLNGLGINAFLINDSLGMARRLERFLDREAPRVASLLERDSIGHCLPPQRSKLGSPRL